MAASILSISLLFVSKGNFSGKNGFTRHVVSGKAVLSSKINNINGIIAISGHGKDQFFFNDQSPNHLFKTREDLSAKELIYIKLDGQKIASRFTIEIDGPDLYVFAGNVPAIYRCDTASRDRIKKFSLSTIYSRSARIDHRYMLLRVFKKNKRQLNQVFGLFDLQNGSLTYENGLSELKGDLGFSNDGLLHYDRATGLAVFVEFYRNRITAFDTSLKIAYRGHTIDTVNDNPTNYNAMKIGNSKEYSNRSPKHFVNLQSCTDAGKLYVASGLKADNELNTEFRNHTVIDTYDVKTGNYRCSFYVPNDEGQKLFKFRIYGNLLIALYSHHIATYRLN